MQTFNALLPAGALCALLTSSAALAEDPIPPRFGWLFDEGAGLVTEDRYETLDGVLEGGTAWSSLTPMPYAGNSCLSFDAFDDRVVVADGRVIAHRRKFSISSWFYWTDTGGFQNTIYGERQSDGFNIMWLGIENLTAEVKGLTFGIKDTYSDTPGTGEWDVVKYPFLPTPHVWHHVAAIFDEDVGMLLYLDGALVAANGETDGFHGPYAAESTIGHSHNTAWPAYWSGRLDEVALFDYALDPGDVMWLATHSLLHLEPRMYEVFCVTDGAGPDCPCGNTSELGNEAGCANTTGAGGRLVASGNPSIFADTVVLSASGLPPGQPVLFFQGSDTVASGIGTPFGDGRMCVGGQIRRLGVKIATGGVASYPEAGDVPISVGGSITFVGTTKHYQAWYRDPGTFCTAATFNLSNGITIDWELF
jgi:hypothetical protein